MATTGAAAGAGAGAGGAAGGSAAGGGASKVSRTDWLKKKQLDEARQRGELEPEKDSEGNFINVRSCSPCRLLARARIVV